MATVVTRWTPDTCGCVIEYSWDNETSEDDRIHTFHKLVEKCPEHSGLQKHKDVHDHVLSENQTKNKMELAVYENIPRLQHESTDEQGNTQKGLHPSIKHEWEFIGKDGDRHLKSSFKGAFFTKEEKNKLKKVSDSFDKPVTLG